MSNYTRQAHNTEAERRACEIRLRAERKYGQLDSKLNPKTRGGRRKLGAISQTEFDTALEQSDMPTTASFTVAIIVVALTGGWW